MSRQPDADLEARSARGYSDALTRHTNLLEAFNRSLRITDELYQRLERDMYAGLGMSQYNPQHAKDAVSLSRALSQTGAVHARLLESEAARAESLSEAEKVSYMIDALRKRPMSVRQAAAAELLKP